MTQVAEIWLKFEKKKNQSRFDIDTTIKDYHGKMGREVDEVNIRYYKSSHL
jgi:hypothetical protein